MAQKRDTNETESSSSIENLDTIFDAAELSPALAVLYSDLGIEDGAAQTKVQIDFRREDGVFARVHSGPADQYDLMDIARRFGSGDYRIQLRGPEPRGRIVVRGQAIIPVMLDSADQERIDNARHPVVAQQQQPQIDVAALIAAMPKPPDVIGTLIQLIPVVTPLISAMRGNPAPAIAPVAAKTPMEQLTETIQTTMLMKQLKGLTTEDNPVGDMLDNADETGLLKTALEAFKVIGNKQNAPIEGTATIVQNAANDAKYAAPVAPQTTPEDDEMNLQLKLLMVAARMKRDTQATAETIYNDAPDAILQVLESDQWQMHLVEILPEAAMHMDWFVSVRDAVVKIANEEHTKELQKAAKKTTRGKSNPPL